MASWEWGGKMMVRGSRDGKGRLCMRNAEEEKGEEGEEEAEECDHEHGR